MTELPVNFASQGISTHWHGHTLTQEHTRFFGSDDNSNSTDLMNMHLVSLICCIFFSKCTYVSLNHIFNWYPIWLSYKMFKMLLRKIKDSPINRTSFFYPSLSIHITINSVNWKPRKSPYPEKVKVQFFRLSGEAFCLFSDD